MCAELLADYCAFVLLCMHQPAVAFDNIQAPFTLPFLFMCSEAKQHMQEAVRVIDEVQQPIIKRLNEEVRLISNA